MSDNTPINEYPNFDLGFSISPEPESSSDSWVFAIDDPPTSSTTSSVGNGAITTKLVNDQSRFPALSDGDIDDILDAATSKRTQTMTRCHVKIFKGKFNYI